MRKICVTYDNGYDSFVVLTFRYFPYLWFIAGFPTRVVTCGTGSDYPSSAPELTLCFCGFARSLVVCVMFHRPLFVLLTFLFLCHFLYCLSFDLRLLITPLISSYFSSVNRKSTDLKLVFQRSTCKTSMEYKNRYISVSDRIYRSKISRQYSFTAQIQLIVLV
jgi:hypothetical protein